MGSFYSLTHLETWPPRVPLQLLAHRGPEEALAEADGALEPATTK
jgi:hypothetical protein